MSKTFGEQCAEMHQQRVNTLTQVTSKVPVGLLNISDDMRKLMFMVKHCILDIDRDYTVDEVNWHWNTIKNLPLYARKAEKLFHRSDSKDSNEDKA